MLDTPDTTTLNHCVTTATAAVSSDDYLDLANIRVETTVSSDSNDIKVVITNEGEQTVCITELQPALTTTARGVINFSRLLADGQLILEPGDGVVVVMTPRGLLPEASSPAFLSASILSAQLRQSFKVITAEPAIGQVLVLEGVRLV